VSVLETTKELAGILDRVGVADFYTALRMIAPELFMRDGALPAVGEEYPPHPRPPPK
jgi:hypothetical protein